jgi:ABC-type nitrate/sulfonate/bicarbonate transport system substrate-binding protein
VAKKLPVQSRLLRIWILASFISLIGSAANATAQDKPLKKIYWGVSTLSPTLWIPWISKEAKIFEKNGLDVEPVLLRGSGQTSQAMVGGSLFASSVASVVTRRKTIREDRDTVMCFVRSFVEGIAYFRGNREFSKKVLSKYLRSNDPEYLEGAYDIFRQDFIAAPYPITKELEAIYDIVAVRRPEIRGHRPEEFVDASFVAELDKSGFIKKLYEQR